MALILWSVRLENSAQFRSHYRIFTTLICIYLAPHVLAELSLLLNK